MTESVVMYQSFHNATKDLLSPSDYGLFYYTLNEYAFNEVEPPEDLPVMVKMAFELCRPQIDAAKDKGTKNKGGAPAGNQNARKSKTEPSAPATAENALEEQQENEVVIEETKPDTTKETTKSTSKTTKNNLETTTKTTKQSNYNYNLNCNSNLNLNANENVNQNCVDSATEVAGESSPPTPLAQVENLYKNNYDELYKLGLLKLEKPKVNFGKTRKLIKDNIDFYGLDTVIDALKRSKADDFCVNKGYSLDLILSSGVMNALINQNAVKKKEQTESNYLPEGHLIF